MNREDGPTKKIRAFAREVIKSALPSTTEPILVASMGRSGSTVAYEALVKAYAAKRLGGILKPWPGFVRDQAWDLKGFEFANGRAYKTHDFPGAGLGIKTVFLFGRASDAARSVINCKTTYGPEWIESHLTHLKAEGPFEDIPTSDVLRLKEQITAWAWYEGAPILCLKYEDLWSDRSQRALSAFAGLKVELPPKRERASKGQISAEIEAQLSKTYGELDRMIDEMPPIIANHKAQHFINAVSSDILGETH